MLYCIVLYCIYGELMAWTGGGGDMDSFGCREAFRKFGVGMRGGLKYFRSFSSM